MKKVWCTFLALALMLSVLTGWAEKMKVNTAVAQMGYVAMTSANKTRFTGCWYTQDGQEETLQWSDEKTVYTVRARSDNGLKLAYSQIIRMGEWDTCAYTEDGRVLYAFNAPEMSAIHTYKTLKNYVQYVGQYIEERVKDQQPVPSGYVLNNSSKKFHRPDCPSVEKIKPKNRQVSNEDRARLIEMGYSPCKQCNP